MATAAREAETPVPEDKAGVYVIYRRRGGKDEVMYIGRAGTLFRNRNESAGKRPRLGNQGLFGRIINGRHGDKTRRQLYRAELAKPEVDHLSIEWFVTFDGRSGFLPILPEAELLQGYYDATGDLPPWNRSA